MRHHLTVHGKVKGTFEYIPDAVQPKWRSYDNYNDCMYWKGKMKDIANRDNLLLQCVSDEVKAKFDAALSNPEMKVEAVVEQPKAVDPTDLNAHQIVLITGFIFGVLVFVAWLRHLNKKDWI